MSVPAQQSLQRFSLASPIATLITTCLFALLIVLTTDKATYVPVVVVDPPDFRPLPAEPTPPKKNLDPPPPKPLPPVTGREPLPVPPIPDDALPERETVFPDPWTLQNQGPADPRLARIESRDPIVVMPPRPEFPERARAQNIEGYAIVSFTVTAAGTIREAQIVEAQPSGWFERAAVSAANRLRYQPKLVEGEPVEAPGMMYKFVFDLED